MLLRKASATLPSAINFPPMSHAVYSYYSNRVGNLVDDPIVPNANSPVIVGSGKFSTTGFARIVFQILNRGDHAIMHPT